MSFNAIAFNPQQGHAVLLDMWNYLKPELMSGHQMQLEAKRKKRTAKQNRRYWGGGVLKQIAEQAAPNGKLYAAKHWHELFKRMFIGVIELPDGSVIGESSTGLTTSEFCDFSDQVEAYAATELGVVFYDLEPHP
jgi:hypothetical protein